jgi:putative peptide zinc metalloprotease protein
MLIPLTGNPITLGRRSDNDIVVDETTVSRRHALVMDTPAGFVVRDLSTTNALS